MRYMSIWKRALVLLLAAVLAACVVQTTDQGAVGVKRKQFMLLSSEEVDAAAAQSYKEELGKAGKAGALNVDKAGYERLKRITSRLIPQTGAFRQDAPGWQWEANLQTSDELNAYCAPGGKIMVYTGLIKKLKLSDDEIAAVVGHEIAHALREHGRERMSQAYGQQVVMSGVAIVTGMDQQKAQLMEMAATVALTLPHSRAQESEADIIGLELAARAGYDPRAAVTLWQKMSTAGNGGPPVFLSTHPSGAQRIKELEARIPQVMPLYEQSKSRQR